MRNLFRFYKRFVTRYVAVNVLLIILAIVESGIGIVIPKAYQYIIDVILPDSNIKGFIILLAGVGIAYVSIAFISYVSGVVCTKMSQKVLADVRVSLFNKVVQQKLSYFNFGRVGKEVSKIENDVNILENLVASGFTEIFSSLSSFLFITYMMFNINISLTLITLILLVCYVMLSKKLIIKTKKSSKEILEAKEVIMAFMTEAFQKIKTIKLNTMENVIKDNYNSLQEKIINTNLFMAKIQITNINLAFFVFKASEILVWVIAGYLIIKGQLTLGMLTAFLAYQRNYFEPIRSISEINGIISSSLAAIDRIFTLLDMENEESGDSYIPELKETLQIHSLSFAYGNKQVLKNINLTIRTGESIAVIGRNGTGKTTLIEILERLYKQQDGYIYWDGISIENYSIESIRKRIAVLPQNVNLFNMSIKDNLGILYEDKIDIQKIFEILQFDKFLNKMPDGLKTIINENESNLSGGEKQRIGVVRALIRKADILIMDEPVNSLDSQQRKLLDEILKIIDFKIKIVITHDLNEILTFSRAIVLEDGCIVADGEPKELLKTNQEFQKLYGGD